MIYHPLSPFKGMRYKHPVELIDVYPTVLDLLQIHSIEHECSVRSKDTVVGKCTPLQGKSLAHVVLGNRWDMNLKKHGKDQEYNMEQLADSETMHGRALANAKPQTQVHGSHRVNHRSPQSSRMLRGTGIGVGVGSGIHKHVSPQSHQAHKEKAHKPSLVKSSNVISQDFKHPDEIQFNHDFAITQFWRCLPKESFKDIYLEDGTLRDKTKITFRPFRDCSVGAPKYNHVGIEEGDNLMLMGYSMRTVLYRYTAWIHFNATTLTPILRPQTLSTLYALNLNTSMDVESPVDRHPTFNTKFGVMLRPMFEELYEHDEDIAEHFTHEELDNLAIQLLHPVKPSGVNGTDGDKAYERYLFIQDTVMAQRRKLFEYIYKHIVYSGRH